MAKIVYVDQEDGKRRVMDNKKLYARLLTKFKDETRIEPIFAALDAGNYEEAQGLAHTLKGVTANLSIIGLHAKVVELEAQIKARSVKPKTVKAVKTVFAQTLPELERVIEENG